MGNGMADAAGATTAIELIVRSTDMDADRNVNNSVFFQYFEQSRLEHLIRFGVVERPRPRDAGAPQFALAQTSAQFRAPAVHRDRLTVTTRTTAIGTKSFTLAYEVRRDDTLVCEGSSVQVWLDAEGQAAPLPPDIRAALDPSLMQPAETS
jgi:acyl-CoA thioester hydrolase